MNCSIELPFDKIFLYVDEQEDLDRDKLKEIIQQRTSRSVKLKGDFFKEKYSKGLEEDIAWTRVRKKNERKFQKPLPKEVKIESEMIEGGKEIRGIIYDGFRLLRLMRELLTVEEEKEHTLVISKRTVGTLEGNEDRYHVRAVINGIPSLISTTGIVEGPAKPREYYFAYGDQREDVLDFRPMSHSDERMESAVASYILQTIFWRLTGDPFCGRDCRLYNSHWQREVIEYQVRSGLCEKHENILKSFSEKPR